LRTSKRLALRARVEDLTYQALDDDATVVRLRAEVDALVHMPLPLSLAHINLKLAALRRKLDRPALELWQIAEEEVA
jgi:hypothetical protein